MSSADTNCSWTERAACRDEPVRRFTHPAGPDDVRKARHTCATCRVRETCLNVALTHPVRADAGIWGGTTEAQRRHIRQGRLTVAEALQDEPTHRRSERTAVPVSHRSAAREADEIEGPRTSTPQRDERRPRVTVHRDPYGDYTDNSGRVLIFEIHGEPPYMLMIDHRPVIRTATVREAAEHAWNVLNRLADKHTTPGSEVAGPQRTSAGTSVGQASRSRHAR